MRTGWLGSLRHIDDVLEVVLLIVLFGGVFGSCDGEGEGLELIDVSDGERILRMEEMSVYIDFFLALFQLSRSIVSASLVSSVYSCLCKRRR